MSARLPDKTEGRHRWIAMATYTLTALEAEQGLRGERVDLGPRNVIGVDVGCLDCEQPYAEVWRKPCPAAAFDWHYHDTAVVSARPAVSTAKPDDGDPPGGSIEAATVLTPDGRALLHMSVNGKVMGQLGPREVRSMALSWLEAAEAAEYDAMIYRFLQQRLDQDADAAALIVRDFRNYREPTEGEIR